ncbi:uncharacterized protein B0P05DRAFT_640879 [Gilbertella persicaria]|uniref:uncharacterized protein n=1 Tax=Gilbertella persicaria TaxID=101096 RepID=UPI00221EB21C|nr:uncharacterized protein B0P05DRAFT_640879 [Gilbertella persicaria]KAI8059058.1 hypothetical protein B0P05DRAFT_640879 [Gilbertella persicaria]
MTAYSTLRNPLLEDYHTHNFSKKLKDSQLSLKGLFNPAGIRISSHLGHRKIVPSSLSSSKKVSCDHAGHCQQQQQQQQQYRYLIKNRREQNEPLVHYNGPYETLDQLPEEKLAWITTETLDSQELRHPLLDYPRSIVFRKPYYRHASSLGYYRSNEQASVNKPRATFFLQVINQNSSKPCLVRSSMEMNNQVFSGSFAASQKCGKHGSQTNFDETYILDVDTFSTATLSIYAQPKTALSMLNSRFSQPEVCLGTQEFKIQMRPSEKKLKRITIQDKESHDQYQVLIVFGTYVSSRVMTLLDNKRIYEGFLTVYTRGKLIPRWTRYWAALYPGHIELYDFEYKETKDPLYKISLKALLDVFHPPTDDDERLVDVGSLGLALQFSEESLMDKMINPDFEYRMYILPDDLEKSQEWEQALLHAASLINEFRYDESYSAIKVNTEDQQDSKTTIIYSKFLW